LAKLKGEIKGEALFPPSKDGKRKPAYGVLCFKDALTQNEGSMCGIAGEYRFGSGNVPLSALTKATSRQAARGPDGVGLYCLDRLALGHRRLKIFDLTERAAQPMVDHASGLALVFNGAIYNFRELRGELKAKGYRFASDGDTETLLKAWHAWGKDCVSRLRGMFAFAVWERDTGKLTLARDRLGVKPLYYAATPHGLKFASTLPAMLEFDGVDTSIDKEALHYYLTFHAVPEPLTLLSGVKKLPPGSSMTVYPDGRSERETYWRLRFNDAKTDPSRSEEEGADALHAALKAATERQLAADVPVGVLLSGGLDSSLLVALAAERGRKVKTFSVGFESAEGQEGDEFAYSDIVAARFGTDHHRMSVSDRQLADSLGECVSAMSEPMPSHDNIGFYLLSREVASHVKVALSGQGADEIFAGYDWFRTMPSGPVPPAQAARMILDKVADRSFEEYAALVAPEYRCGNLASSFMEELCERNGSTEPLDGLLVYESTFALANGPLGRVDNMTMAASLEARVPFLDEEVVELAASMPLRHKLPDGGKHLLKRLGRRLLPKEIVDRPKGYFPVPALMRLRGDVLALMRDVLSPENVKRRGLFDQASVRALLDAPDRHATPSGASKLWQIGLLEYWLRRQGL
jgi:asparagine synthase (glutamine-hydrolysing)